jgi:alanine-synthesizing transaminase
MISRRGAFDLTPNALARAMQRTPPRWDLTGSNPTKAGLAFTDVPPQMPSAGSLALYDPHPRGLASARRLLGVQLDWNPEHLVLTSSTSEAYSFLLKLFCDPGDQVAIPEPSYPLLPMLSRLEGVVASPYSLRYDGQWHIDRAGFLASMGPQVKLIVAVSPDNPTGAFLSSDDLNFLLSHGVPVVLDEVFAAYDLRREQPSALQHTKSCSGLLFALGGLSKAAALPQMKLGWMAVSGAEPLVQPALAQLDLITDTYLSVNDVTQHELPALLTVAEQRRGSVFERVQQNRRTIGELLRHAPEISVLPTEGGWCQVLRLPTVLCEQDWVLGFLQSGVLVQPGWFYDFPDEAWVMVSLLTETGVFSEGIHRIAQSVAAVIDAD